MTTDKRILVDARSAAAMLSMSKSFFYSQLSQGRIPQPVKIGRKRLWSTGVLESWAIAESAKTNGGKT